MGRRIHEYMLSNKNMNQSDFMLQAVDLARKGTGYTAPNPSVGALVVSGDMVLGRGWHRAYGENHAEVEAIRDALAGKADLSSCTLYVTLEPCNHHGKTPPCTNAIVRAGIKNMVVGTRDPNPGVAGGGVEFLRSRGVRVTVGIEREKCQDLIADFKLWQKSRRAYVFLKTASTLDGKIATRTGHSRWVTSRASRMMVHELRSRVGAVLVGGNTFYQDNPALTCRSKDNSRQPLAVVLTTRLPDARGDFFLLRHRPKQTVFWSDMASASSTRAEQLTSMGCTVMGLKETDGGLDLEQGLERLRQEMGVYHVLCEGGGKLALSLLEQKLADEIWAFLALKVLGDEQAAAVYSGRDIQLMDQALKLRLGEMRHLGNDIWFRMFPEVGNNLLTISK